MPYDALADKHEGSGAKMNVNNKAAVPGEFLAGLPAPEATVEDAEGRPIRLRDLWKEGPIVLVFLRHLG